MNRLKPLNQVADINSELSAELLAILRDSPLFTFLFSRASRVGLPNWYIAGGCVAQTVWNWKLGLNPLHGLRDVDIVYFKAKQTAQAEEIDRLRIQELFKDSPIPVDVTNEARVHEWYPRKFGYTIPPYKSTEDGISTWLPAFSVGVRPEGSRLEVKLPRFGGRVEDFGT